MISGDDTPTVLVADDDEDYTDTVAFWLRDEYDIKTAYSGSETLEQYDESVDVVLLDRWFSERNGDQLLSAIRERPGRSCVAIVTAAEPDLDLLDLSFEEYLMKPVDKAELTETVDRLFDLRSEDEAVRDYVSLRATLRVLQSPRRAPHVTNDYTFDELRDRVRQKRAQLGDVSEQYIDLDYGRDRTNSSTPRRKTTD